LKRVVLEILQCEEYKLHADRILKLLPSEALTIVLEQGWLHRALQLCDAYERSRINEVIGVFVDHCIRLDTLESLASTR
jgi:hypothetical protein